MARGKPVSRRLGQIVVQEKFARREQVEECLRVQASELSRTGKHRALGEILIERGIVTNEQILRMLSDQGEPTGQTRFGPYELIRKLGQGKSGAVYEARVTSTAARAALKLLSPECAGDEQFLRRFKRDAAIGLKLDHPNVVRVVASGEFRGTQYLALEFVQGGSLEERMATQPRMAEREALKIIHQAALAIQHAGQHGLVHHDIKPGSIMIDSVGTVKLGDFGVEQSADTAAREIHADLHALGAVLYHMVTGNPPQSDDLPPPETVRPDLSEGCVSLIKKMTAKGTDDRYQTPAELIRDIQLLLGWPAS